LADAAALAAISSAVVRRAYLIVTETPPKIDAEYSRVTHPHHAALVAGKLQRLNVKGRVAPKARLIWAAPPTKFVLSSDAVRAGAKADFLAKR
jgi:hypothetical protein